MSRAMDNLLKAEPVCHSGETNVWLTPRWVLDALGPFDLDPCGHQGWETAATHFYEEDDGLTKDWGAHQTPADRPFVWCNPPYGTHTPRWVGKWIEHGNGFLLVANRSDTGWWQRVASASTAIWFPRGRIQFLRSDLEEGSGIAFASAIFAIGARAAERLREIGHSGILVKYPSLVLETQGELFQEAT